MNISKPATDEAPRVGACVDSEGIRRDEVGSPPPPPQLGEASAQCQAGYLCHELRAPLTNIIAAISMLGAEKNQLSEEGRACCAMVRSNATRLQGLVDDVLDYAKLLSGKMPLSRERVAAARLASDAVDSLRAFAAAKDVIFEIKISASAMVNADPRRTVQVLINLISNAIKHSPRGGFVRISAREESGGIFFSVNDQGPGVPQAFRPAVFAAFEQAAGGGAKLGGTGLGLTLARRFVRAQGGEIWLEDAAADAGATFTFVIPDSTPVPLVGGRPESDGYWARLRVGCAVAAAALLMAVIGRAH